MHIGTLVGRVVAITGFGAAGLIACGTSTGSPEPSSRQARLVDRVERKTSEVESAPVVKAVSNEAGGSCTLADFTTPLHNEFLCFRGDRLESIWPIAARGMLQ